MSIGNISTICWMDCGSKWFICVSNSSFKNGVQASCEVVRRYNLWSYDNRCHVPRKEQSCRLPQQNCSRSLSSPSLILFLLNFFWEKDLILLRILLLVNPLSLTKWLQQPMVQISNLPPFKTPSLASPILQPQSSISRSNYFSSSRFAKSFYVISHLAFIPTL